MASLSGETTFAVRRHLAKEGIERPDLGDIARALRAVDGSGEVEHVRELYREFSGLGELTAFLEDADLTDLVLNGDGSVWIDRGAGMELAGQLAGDPRTLAVRLAAACGARVDDSCPFADGVLTDLPSDIRADGLRVHIALSPPAAGGPCISLRAIAGSRWTVERLASTKTLHPQLVDTMRGLIAARKNFLISGGTGSGKTTLLAAMLAEVPRSQRVLLVEDTPELMPSHPHCVRLSTRRANTDGAGEIGMSELVKQSLRMRPDRVVVGEVRGKEIADLLIALNTGHDGSAGTLHANSPEAVPGRLVALGTLAGLQPAAVEGQAADGIDVVLHMQRTPEGRRLTHISELMAGDGTQGGFQLRTVWASGPRAGWDEFQGALC